MLTSNMTSNFNHLNCQHYFKHILKRMYHLVVLLRASNDLLALLPKPCHRPNPFDQGSRLANVAQIFGSPGVPWKVCGGEACVFLVCVLLFSNFGLEQRFHTAPPFNTNTTMKSPTTSHKQEAKHRIQDPEVPCHGEKQFA